MDIDIDYRINKHQSITFARYQWFSRFLTVIVKYLAKPPNWTFYRIEPLETLVLPRFYHRITCTFALKSCFKRTYRTWKPCQVGDNRNIEQITRIFKIDYNHFIKWYLVHIMHKLDNPNHSPIQCKKWLIAVDMYDHLLKSHDLRRVFIFWIIIWQNTPQNATFSLKDNDKKKLQNCQRTILEAKFEVHWKYCLLKSSCDTIFEATPIHRCLKKIATFNVPSRFPNSTRHSRSLVLRASRLASSGYIWTSAVYF